MWNCLARCLGYCKVSLSVGCSSRLSWRSWEINQEKLPLSSVISLPDYQRASSWSPGQNCLRRCKYLSLSLKSLDPQCHLLNTEWRAEEQAPEICSITDFVWLWTGVFNSRKADGNKCFIWAFQALHEPLLEPASVCLCHLEQNLKFCRGLCSLHKGRVQLGKQPTLRNLEETV